MIPREGGPVTPDPLPDGRTNPMIKNGTFAARKRDQLLRLSTGWPACRTEVDHVCAFDVRPMKRRVSGLARTTSCAG